MSITKFFAVLLASSMAMSTFAQQSNLEGFAYGTQKAPAGNEWQSPENLSLNKEQPRAYFFPFQDVVAARKFLPENSSYWQSLDGDWKFNWAADPDSRPKNFFEAGFDVSKWDNIAVPSNWNIVGIQKDDTQKYGVPIYVNQPVIFYHERKVDDWRGGVMRTPPTNWTTYKHRNEVGSYRRDFSVPAGWDGRETFISFDGVDSFFYLWINGQYVGFSKNSRNAARFNITPYLKKGTNTLAVEVYRSSDGSFLEAQDMFRLPGIFRTVAIYSTPKVYINNLVAIPDLDKNYKDGSLKITADIRNLSGKEAKDYKVVYSLYANELYSDENRLVANVSAVTPATTVASAKTVAAKAVMSVSAPKLWSAEEPYRYTLIAELKDSKGKVVETTSVIVGFRKVEVRDTPASEDEFALAGRYYYVNGKPVKLKGVNRHESNPELGHALTRKIMEDEVMLMKRGNINHVRNSHYPDAPYWYYLADKYGIYLEDEANLESHQYYYGKESLSHPVEWRKAHVARVLEMVNSTINNPSVVIWSLGNEAGPGENFVHAYNELKRVDTSRPVQYERNNDIVDIGSNQYPSIAWMKGAVTGKYNIKYPFHVSEYAHSMGNAVGNLVDYWDAIESTNFFMGGAIWDWVDQSMYNYTPDGLRYAAYGGDFGDTPNDGQFVMNGIVFGDLTPKPQYWEVKKVYQYIGVRTIDLKQGKVEIFNKNYFTDLSGYDVVWSLWEDGKQVKEGVVAMPEVAPRRGVTVTLPISSITLKNDAEYFVKVQFLLNTDMPWAVKGFVQAQEQMLLRSAVNREAPVARGNINLNEGGDIATVSGVDFEAKFDMAQGTIHSLKYKGSEVIVAGEGPRLDALRAFTNNDNWFYEAWFENGLHNLKHKSTSKYIEKMADGRVVLAFTVVSQAPNAAQIKGGTSSGKNSVVELTERPFGDKDFKFTTNQVWTIYPDGSIELQASITSNNPSLILPRLGYVLKVPEQYQNFTYYGRGAADNYNDRKTGSFIEVFKSTIADEFVPFPKPQDTGNHEDVRWCALTNKSGNGVIFVATDRLSVSALPYSAMDMTLAGHPHQLPKAKDTYLHLDYSVTGLGGNSCGQGGPLAPDRVLATAHQTGFIIRPIAGDNFEKMANVAPSGDTPLTITRARNGMLEIYGNNPSRDIYYSLNGGAAVKYEQPFLMRGGVSIKAWYESNKNLATTASFDKIENVVLEVINASSQEAGEGNASNLTDSDPNTYWHTMYSVTVAKFPHWVDFDAGEVKPIKGFVYLPRQNSPNGNIKDYEVFVSTDGKNWGAPVARGQFEDNRREKRITLDKPVKGRYVRFNARSSQNGQDFASGAEFTVLAE